MAEQFQADTQILWTKGLDCDDRPPGRPEGKGSLVPLEAAMSMVASLVRPVARRETVSVSNLLGRRLAETLTARYDLPPFDQSAMDGYALAGSGLGGEYCISARRDTRAGEVPGNLLQGQATRISTGARIPSGADRVVLQEHAEDRNNSVVLRDGAIPVGANIRPRGEDVRRGDVLLSRGDRIDARKLALITSQGFPSVNAISAPRVAVISAGNELRQPGEPLGIAEVFDSNRPMLSALAAQCGADVADGGQCGDDTQELGLLVARLADQNDLIIISGGSSFGEGDVTAAALRAAGARINELKIAMKPGKPALVGKLRRTIILGLPGNPFAAFASWFTLGRSVMAALFGLQPASLGGREHYVSNELRRRPGRTEFAPARRIRTGRGDTIEFLGRGGSGRLLPLSRADGLARIEASRGSVLAGELVSFISFDDGDIL